MATYTSEAYTATNGLAIMWTYVFSDGEKWTKMDEEYIAPDMQIRRRTRVWRQEYEGGDSRRSTLKALTAKTSAATITSHTVIDGRKELADTAPVELGIIPADTRTRDQRRDDAIAAAKAENEALTTTDAYLIEPGYDESPAPTNAQHFVLKALHAAAKADAPFDVIPAGHADGEVIASADLNGQRFAFVIDPEGYLDAVKVRITAAGVTDWVKLDAAGGTKFYDLMKTAAREARLGRG